MRLENKVAIVTGAGQTAGVTMGNGRATALLFARHGAKVLLVDRDDISLKETADLIESEQGRCLIHNMDVTDAAACREMIRICQSQFGRVDILHNNVGIGAGDRGVTHLSEENWDRIMDVNLKSMFLTAKYAIPVMREQRAGVVINISSVAAIASSSMLAYKTSKAGVMALTQQIASANARFGIRANCILPGLMNTPMAIEGYSQLRGVSREQVVSERDARVPLGNKMGTAWDVAQAALFLASDEAGFITGVNLPVDGGQSIRVG